MAVDLTTGDCRNDPRPRGSLDAWPRTTAPNDQFGTDAQGLYTSHVHIQPLSVAGAWLFSPVCHEDTRGEFVESFTAASLAEVGSPDFDVCQLNTSRSHQGVIRGVHASRESWGQAKYVTCAHGVILDCVVDLRVDSPTFGAWDAVMLDDWDRKAVFLQAGLGHAFQVLSETATVVYACSAPYSPAHEFSVNPMDAELSLPWRPGLPSILSERDRAAPDLGSVRNWLQHTARSHGASSGRATTAEQQEPR